MQHAKRLMGALIDRHLTTDEVRARLQMIRDSQNTLNSHSVSVDSFGPGSTGAWLMYWFKSQPL